MRSCSRITLSNAILSGNILCIRLYHADPYPLCRRKSAPVLVQLLHLHRTGVDVDGAPQLGVPFCLASHVQGCAFDLFIQPPFPSATDALGSARTGISVRLETQSLAYYWAQARNLLGFALFLHLFNFLKFLVKFKSLGTLIRTLSLAAPELLSFSSRSLSL
eukprot:scpid37299/ scgid0980/ 